MRKFICPGFLCVCLACGASSLAAGPPGKFPAPETDKSAPVRGAQPETGARALEGTRPPDWQAERWLNSPPLHLPDLRGQVVLVRWWTAGCPYCRTTAPVLRGLYDRYHGKGLVVVGMYHHKEKEPFDPAVYEKTTKEYGFKFPTAVDPDWRSFHSWMRDRKGNPVDTGWTSVTFLLDKHGVVRYVHPGGSYEKGDADHKQIVRLVEKLLAES